MILLIDLDGTLTDTAHLKFKPFKDGLSDFNISEIPVFPGAIDFIREMNKNHKIIIVSDSHPKYVNKIASQIFRLEITNSNINDGLDGKSSQTVYLADKPNTDRTLELLDYYVTKWDPHFPDIRHVEEMDEFLIIGDSWLDIELGRRLNIRTVLTQFYQATDIEQRDGIGQDWKPIKMGPTYYAKNFKELTDIVERPIENLLAIEAIFQNHNSNRAVKFLHRPYPDGFATFRCLARQEDGECDKYARADKYYQIDNPNRTKEFLNSLVNAVSNYLNEVASYKNINWDYFTYVSDKKTTSPPNKMKEIIVASKAGNWQFKANKLNILTTNISIKLKNFSSLHKEVTFVCIYFMNK